MIDGQKKFLKYKRISTIYIYYNYYYKSISTVYIYIYINIRIVIKMKKKKKKKILFFFFNLEKKFIKIKKNLKFLKKKKLIFSQHRHSIDFLNFVRKLLKYRLLK